MNRGRPLHFTTAELGWIKANAARPRAEAHAEFVIRFGRTDVSKGNFAALCKRKCWLTGRTGHFLTGQTSWNKGRPCPEGTGGRHPNARVAHFKKGVRQGVATRLYKPIGTERISKDGYRERKIHDGMPLQSRWRGVHLLNWEAANGPLPKGKALKCLDGDKLNTDVSNWAAVPRGLLPRLNGIYGRNYDQAPADLKPTIMAIAKLEHLARERRKEKECGRGRNE